MRKGEWWFKFHEDSIHERATIRLQRGQTFLMIAIFIAFFLLAVMGLATDYGQVWAHRQIAQAAADAACEAGAADLFLVGTDPTAAADFPGLSFSWIGSAGSTFNCSSNASSPPCQYANLNGYSGANVKVSFPPSLSVFRQFLLHLARLRLHTSGRHYGSGSHVFTKLALARSTFTIFASAGCGLHAVTTPVPLVVLHRTAPLRFRYKVPPRS